MLLKPDCYTFRIGASQALVEGAMQLGDSVPLTLAELTERLMASYVRAGGINHLDGKNLPSKRAIAEITVDLLRLLFPGFFDEKPIHSSEIEAVSTALLASVLGRLENEIRKSLEYAAPDEAKKQNCATWRAR